MDQTSPKMVAEIERPATDWPSRLAGASGLFAIVLGATVMLGWHLHNTTVVRLTPALAPMAYNAALTFVLCGAGLLASAFGRRRLAAGLGVATAVIGLLTALEFLFGLDLHIDQFFVRAYFPQETSTPNRMAPNVATGFILLGSALVLLARPSARRRPLILGLLGSSVAALGLAPLVGLLIGIRTAFGWGNLTRMALHAAIGLAILGIAIVAFAWQEGKEKETGAPRWLPILIGVAGAMISLALWQALVLQERNQIDRLVQLEANNLLDDAIAQLDARAKGLDRLGLQWETLGRPKPAEWDWDASLAFDYRIPQVTAWVDASLHARRIVPAQGNEVYGDLDLGGIELVRGALQTAQLRREMRATRWFTLPSGDLGFLIARPLFPQGQFDGFIVGIFTLHRTFPVVFRPIGEARYSILLLEEGKQLLNDRPATVPYDDKWGRESEADFYGKKLRLRVLPPRGLVSEISTVLPGVFLTGELLMTLLLSLAVYLFQTSRIRGYQLATVNRELTNEIAERERAQEELKRHVQELARSNAELEQFAYVASHDLQEPLRMVASYTQLLAKRYRSKLDEDADDFIEYAVDGARRMQNLIGDLLAYSRVGTRGKEFAPADTEQVLEVVLSNLSKAIEETGARVTHDPLPTVMADDSQLVQLFQNLIGNAVKFHGADPPCVHISAHRQMRDWIFSVRDNGIGIETEHQQRIFVIFQRLHGKSDYPGTGIGLAICKKIVERHHGRIRVESQPGKGSTFYFAIPA